MLSNRTARVSDNSFLYAFFYFERDGDGLEGEAVRVIGGGPRRGHWFGSFLALNACTARRWRAAGTACEGSCFLRALWSGGRAVVWTL